MYTIYTYMHRNFQLLLIRAIHNRDSKKQQNGNGDDISRICAIRLNSLWTSLVHAAENIMILLYLLPVGCFRLCRKLD